MEQQIVVFTLNGQFFGVPIRVVESIIKMQPITVLPQSPEFVKGVINLRGKILPVVDLRKHFGFDPSEADRDSRIIVVASQNNLVGMQVDGVSEVLTLSDETVEPPPAMALTVRSEFITGIARMKDYLIILLDLDRALSSEQQAELAEVNLEAAGVV